MPLPDVLPIEPFTRPVQGIVTVPGSKSLTNRALLLAALCDRTVTLTGALFSEDTAWMAEGLRKLGIRVSEVPTGQELTIHGQGGRIPAEHAEINVGLAGTAARFLTALCAAAPKGRFRLYGTEQMHRRPMRGLVQALRALGAAIRCEGDDGFLPFTVEAHGLRAGTVEIDAGESSQMLSALLMVAPLATSSGQGSRLQIRLSRPVREPFVEMTAKIMRQFGADVASADGVYQVAQGQYRLPAARVAGEIGVEFPIEPDATAASYFLALPLVVGGTLELFHVNRHSLQGDIQFEAVLQRAGLRTSPRGGSLVASGPADADPKGVAQDFRNFSDTFLTLAAVAPLLSGTTRISGIAHTRKQETDRVEAMAKELRKILGANQVAAAEDSLEITPFSRSELRRNAQTPIEIDTHGDHRFAMSFAILGSHDLHGDGRPWIAIRNPGVCAKTFPDFFDRLGRLRASGETVRP